VILPLLAPAILATLLQAIPSAFAASIGAASADSLRSPQEDLDALRGRMDEVRRRAAQREEEEISLLGEMERLDRLVAEKSGEVARLRSSERALARQVGESERRAEQLRREEEEGRERLAGRAEALYKYGQAHLSALVWVGADPGERERGARYLRVAALSDAGLFRRARLLFEEQIRNTALLTGRRQDLRAAREALVLELAGLAERKRDKQELLRSLREEKEARVALLGEMEASAGRLQRMIEEMRRGEAGESGFASARGLLRPPVAGPVLVHFGRRRNPRFDTYTVSRGITIKAAEGTPAQAVYEGRVLFADWFRGYGRIAILDHGGGFYTLYGHLATLAVAAGDEVDAGATVGAVGETGSVEGPALYFEIRKHGRPEDPVPWFAAQPKSGGRERP
jgi:septal ring factor EnvC (AmiA/AmiB activator)